MLNNARVFFQPQIAAADNSFVGIECLLREKLPDGRIEGPSRLLSEVERTNNYNTLDWWVLEEGILASKRWPQLSVAINVSASQFMDPDFPEKLENLVNRHHASAAQIDLEILEGGLIQNIERAVQTMNALRAKGIKVSLDDFGTGYSSLNYLQKLPIDKLKLDKTIVDGVGQLKPTAVIQAVCALARALGIKVLAEGVERAEQVTLLRTLGCHQYQGFYFSRAVDTYRIDELLACGWPSRPSSA